MSDSLGPHEPQHARPPCPSPTPGIHPNPCPLSQWCHLTISSSVVPFSSCPQSFPASGSFQMSQFFASGGQSIGVSASAISPSNGYLGLISFRMDWLDLPAVQETLKSLLQHHGSKASILPPSAFFIVQLSHPYMTTGKTIDWLSLSKWWHQIRKECRMKIEESSRLSSEASNTEVSDRRRIDGKVDRKKGGPREFRRKHVRMNVA